MRRLGLGLLILALGAAAVVLTRPSPVRPTAYRPPPAPALAGALAPTGELERIELLGDGRLPGPEDVELDPRGRILCGLADGTIRRLDPDDPDAPIETFADTGGRPLGLDLDRDGTLWVADALRGLVAVDPAGRIEVRLASSEGAALGFADDVDTAPDGRVYLSDASGRIGPDRIHLAPFEGDPSGRLIEFDPASGSSRVLLGGLHFANGVAVSIAGDFVLVAETFRYRIRRHWLSGPRRGEGEVFADNLPGFPDGVSSDGRGGFWVALFTVRNALLDRVVHPRRWLKRLVAKIPAALQPGARRYGLVVRLDGAGRPVESLHDPGGRRFPNVTSVEQWDDRLYLGSIESRAVGRYRLAKGD